VTLQGSGPRATCTFCCSQTSPALLALLSAQCILILSEATPAPATENSHHVRPGFPLLWDFCPYPTGIWGYPQPSQGCLSSGIWLLLSKFSFERGDQPSWLSIGLQSQGRLLSHKKGSASLKQKWPSAMLKASSLLVSSPIAHEGPCLASDPPAFAWDKRATTGPGLEARRLPHCRACPQPPRPRIRRAEPCLQALQSLGASGLKQEDKDE